MGLKSKMEVESGSTDPESITYQRTMSGLAQDQCQCFCGYGARGVLKKEYVRQMVKLSGRPNIAWEDMVKSLRLTQCSHIVTLHWAVDSGTKSELGFAADNRRANVILTRAWASLIVVANGAIITVLGRSDGGLFRSPGSLDWLF
ncbi:uncharacterized protein BO88DRAFT_470703 [Aspergillus vadensis CBS 113365]|uniref:DNA2/NAM7 helicase-like C-terminal domain-containing protein n=1 Tax=Aspergillus vadensis (strain CBS 113365 / IMI 142717 / IBT 24658) TaxID=1448311 RepID=A0A319B1B9_ASPVC|nr:hypothetical protein BO88DRAFT_470703 [Aspergillus vadensis CBS 113365]PYH65614.1 hypothetical protein BO88DRAFT_470703 [Aspergillus vadensis CBS 113365]